MKGKLIIEKSEKIKRTNYLFEEEIKYDNNDYLIAINLPINSDVDLSKIKQGFYKFLSRKLSSKQYNKDFPNRIKMIKESIDSNIDLIDNCNHIVIDSNDSNLFFKVYEFYKNKDIKIEDFNCKNYPVSKEGYEEACRKYNNNKNMLVKIEGNIKSITLEEYKKTYEFIEKFTNKIKSFNLSPLEQVIYVFDYTKNRYYVEENSNESLRKSRDLTSVLFGNKIVCEGYATIFSTILKKLGFQACNYCVDTYNNSRHANAIVRIKDDKYNIDGIYYFDPTWDSKQKTNIKNNDFYDMTNLNRYNHCGNYWVSDRYIDKTFGELTTFYDKELFTKIKNKQPLTLDDDHRINEYIAMIAFENGETKLEHSHGAFYREDLKSKFIEMLNKEQLEEFVENLSTKIKVIDNMTLLKVIYNVRKIEYYDNPEEFSLTWNDLFQILFNFRVYDRWYDDYCENAHKFINGKEQEIERIRLTKVLSNISKKR